MCRLEMHSKKVKNSPRKLTVDVRVQEKAGRAIAGAMDGKDDVGEVGVRFENVMVENVEAARHQARISDLQGLV